VPRSENNAWFLVDRQNWPLQNATLGRKIEGTDFHFTHKNGVPTRTPRF
jgi:hypothetical protein